MNENIENNRSKLMSAGKWLLIAGVALLFIPGMFTAFFGFYLGPAIISVLDILGYLSLPLIVIGGIMLMLGHRENKKRMKETASASGAPVSIQRSRESLVGWNILTILLSLPVSFAILFAGLMASDSGTPGANLTSMVIMGVGIGYLVFAILSVYMSQTRRSLKWTLWPMVIPVLLIAVSILAPVVLMSFMSIG